MIPSTGTAKRRRRSAGNQGGRRRKKKKAACIKMVSPATWTTSSIPSSKNFCRTSCVHVRTSTERSSRSAVLRRGRSAGVQAGGKRVHSFWPTMLVDIEYEQSGNGRSGLSALGSNHMKRIGSHRRRGEQVSKFPALQGTGNRCISTALFSSWLLHLPQIGSRPRSQRSNTHSSSRPCRARRRCTAPLRPSALLFGSSTGDASP